MLFEQTPSENPLDGQRQEQSDGIGVYSYEGGQEKDARKKEIDAMYAHLNEKIKDYVKDYGSIRLNRAVKYDGDFYCHTLSDLFNFWSL